MKAYNIPDIILSTSTVLCHLIFHIKSRLLSAFFFLVEKKKSEAQGLRQVAPNHFSDNEWKGIWKSDWLQSYSTGYNYKAF